MMLNKNPIDWFSKKQLSVESATYGSEFVAARIGTDKIVEMRYMLRMLGVPVDGPSYMFGDNMAVINSASIPESNHKKRHNLAVINSAQLPLGQGSYCCQGVEVSSYQWKRESC